MGSGFLGEFVGTTILVLMGNGVVSNVLLNKSKGQNSGWIVIATGWAFAVLAGVLTAVALGSRAHLNPAVTLAFYALGDFPANQLLPYIGGQFAGAFCGAVLVWLTYLPHWKETESPAMKLACFSTGPAIRAPFKNMLTELIGTFVLVLLVIATFNKAVGTTGVLGPLVVALIVYGIGLSLGGSTGFAINPARDLGARVAHAVLPIPGKGASDWGYSWVPVVGPILGGVCAIGLARLAGLI
jgi:glycerol uptake facilitator protein